jgi:hypothetical protein
VLDGSPGKKMKVFEDELDDHLAHGDSIGPCPRA